MTKPLKHHLRRAVTNHAKRIAEMQARADKRQAEHDAAELTRAQADAGRLAAEQPVS